ncbi:helix-turn-helix transcriptional regulator [Actinomycetospora sp. TBRC 11914]|uniref:helix-turn-helix transcriptional regulator n=1 Tax=Actinomycetospora sp. TBRC 11914 TaxID=2729387 RepID=UPI00145EF6BD|nr:helix-turn-helix transcriptional regulator [Actinomycetospora sp. TBRC 11914]NMO93721.1 helix-turn-helix transcriptional regulator [Actinomycetospora sp. TBRC 11914]
MTSTVAAPGALLRGWRTRRRRSQMDLALDVGVSTRHLSFVETGRSRASRELLLDLADHLEVPLRERNALLLAAGYAPVYGETRLDDAGLDAVREALGHLLAGHEPFPALVIDRCGDVVMSNRAVGPLLRMLDPAWSRPPVNVYRLSLDPDGLAPHIRNLDQWAGHLVHRLERLTDLTGDPRLAELLAEVRAHVPDDGRAPDRTEHVVLPLHLAHPDGDLRLFSTITHFGAAWDVTLDELSVETFVPADAATRARLAAWLDPEASTARLAAVAEAQATQRPDARSSRY